MRIIHFARRLGISMLFFLTGAVLLPAQNISINLNGVTVSKAVSEIQKISGYSVIVKSHGLNLYEEVTLDLSDVSVVFALEKVFECKQ